VPVRSLESRLLSERSIELLSDADVVVRNGALASKVASGAVKITGDAGALSRFVGLSDQPDPRFAIVTP
jgi:alkyl sulfatase BDS1-like metallo-beta-lactamase superfamily hydrolase